MSILSRQFSTTRNIENLRHLHAPTPLGITVPNILSKTAQDYVDALDLDAIAHEYNRRKKEDLSSYRSLSHPTEIPFFNKKPRTKTLESLLPAGPGKHDFISESVSLAETHKRLSLGELGYFIIRSPLTFSAPIHIDGPIRNFRGLATIRGESMYIFDDVFYHKHIAKHKVAPRFNENYKRGKRIPPKALFVWKSAHVPHSMPTTAITQEMRAQLRFD